MLGPVPIVVMGVAIGAMVVISAKAAEAWVHVAGTYVDGFMIVDTCCKQNDHGKKKQQQTQQQITTSSYKKYQIINDSTYSGCYISIYIYICHGTFPQQRCN